MDVQKAALWKRHGSVFVIKRGRASTSRGGCGSSPASSASVDPGWLGRRRTEIRNDAHRGDSGRIVTMGAVVAPAPKETERVRRVYEREARKYDQNVRIPERLLFSGGREWVCARAKGEVLEIAAGTGLNHPHYPEGVRLTGIEFVPAMLDIARRRALELGRPVELRLGDAQALEFEDATFDTVVCTLSLCTIPDDHAAVAEVRRVLRPGGRFVLLEHVRSPVRAVRGVQRLLAPAFVRRTRSLRPASTTSVSAPALVRTSTGCIRSFSNSARRSCEPRRKDRGLRATTQSHFATQRASGSR